MPGPPAQPGPSSALPERDVSYLKLLETLKSAPGSSGFGVVRRIAAWIDSAPIVELICAHPPWYDDWEVKEGLLHNDVTPAHHRSEIERAIAIFDLLREMDGVTPAERKEIEEDVRYLFKNLTEHDRALVKQRAYDLSASRRGAAASGARPAEATTAEAVAEPASTEWAAAEVTPVAGGAETSDEPDVGVTAVLHDAEVEALDAAPGVGAEEEADTAAFDLVSGVDRTAVAGLPVERQVELAAKSSDEAVLSLLAHQPIDAVQLALLDNPALNDRLAATIARRASANVAAALYRHRRLFMRPLVREALLECPHAPSSALLEVVNGISDFAHLLKLIRSPKVRFLEVKAKARAKLATAFRALGINEKMAAVRRGGPSLLKELWSDFFRDEALVMRCVQEKQVDTSIVLEIARSKIAPRRALEVIGATPQWTANYQVCLELVLNPKTPRQVVTVLIKRLSPADRKMVQSNPALPESIRRMT